MASQKKSKEQSQSQLKSWLKVMLGLDVRSLALFRIGLALLILVDLLNRSRDLSAHYTDVGILPRAALLEKFLNPWLWSIHLISGQALFQIILFVLSGVVALALLVGYRTRLATILSWGLLLSLHTRNPMILNSGDVEFRLLLFWGMFLPLGACYSIDRALNLSRQPLPKQILSGGTIALTLQICLIYWCAWAFKSHPIWLEGEAVYYALNIDQFATPLAHFLLNFPALLVFFTHATLVIEGLGPFLLFVPVYTGLFRLIAVLLFIGLHLGFGLVLKIGIFPLVSAVGWLALLPNSFWDSIAEKARSPQQQGLVIYYDKECGFCRKVVHLIRTFLILPRQTPLLCAQDQPAIYDEMQKHNSWVVVDRQGGKHFQWEAIAYVCSLSPLLFPLAPVLRWKPLMAIGTKFYKLIANHRATAAKFTAPFKFRRFKVESSRRADIFALLFLGCVIAFNIQGFAPETVKLPSDIDWVGTVFRLDQKWSMFTPYPLRSDGWYVMPGELRDGTEIDVFRQGKPVTWEKPALVSTDYPNQRWRKYMMNLRLSKNESRRLYYGRYLCRSWNRRHAEAQQLERFKIYFMLERTLPDYQPPETDQTLLWQHVCSNAED